MLVLLGPEFDGTPLSYDRLARLTGFVAYDLRTRLRPGVWGVVRTLGDPTQAMALAQELGAEGFAPVLVDSNVAHDAERRIVHARKLTLSDAGIVARLADRDMPIEHAALACVVRGEVQPGRSTHRSSSSSSNFRAVSPTSEPPIARESHQLPFEAYQAADIHFLSVPWILRLDARGLASAGDSGVRALDALADALGERAGVRVDRGARVSSVATFAEQTMSTRSSGGDPPSLRETRREQADERFDPYSRLIGEAERLRHVASSA